MLKISELKQGDIVWECDRGQNLRLEIQSQPQYVTRLHGAHALGWHVVAKTDDGALVDLFTDDETSCYGPKLYREPMYISRSKNNTENTIVPRVSAESQDKVKQVIIMRTKYPDGKGGTRKLRSGKMIAQGAHASMAFMIEIINGVALTQEEKDWIDDKFTKICLYVESEEELLQLYDRARACGLTSSLIQDAGDTEFGGVPTYTALAIGPHHSSKIDPLTKHLPLL